MVPIVCKSLPPHTRSHTLSARQPEPVIDRPVGPCLIYPHPFPNKSSPPLPSPPQSQTATTPTVTTTITSKSSDHLGDRHHHHLHRHHDHHRRQKPLTALGGPPGSDKTRTSRARACQTGLSLARNFREREREGVRDQHA